MNIQYFKGITSLDQLKLKYRELIKQYHPDLPNGDLEAMKIINIEYDYLLLHVKNFKGEYLNDSQIKLEKASRDILEKIDTIEGLIIEVCGNWLWVSGETRTHKEYLKSIGLHWQHKKQMWYFNPDTEKGWKPSKAPIMDMEYIRTKYGSVEIEKKEKAQGIAG